MTPAEKTRWITAKARELGFDLCGVTRATESAQSEEAARMPEWLDAGYAGEMEYLHDERRTDPERALAGARSVIMVALNYNADAPHSTDAGVFDLPDEMPRGWISRYAWGDDYHHVIWAKLNELVAAMKAEWSDEEFGVDARADSGPVMERVSAKYAGLGWQGKNTCLINQDMGSWMFLGTVLTTLDLEPTLADGEPPAPDLCGNCTLCLEACPTQAFVEPYVLDARKCISYLTIELRGSIPLELRGKMGNALIGCDICQDVCPWNRKAPVTKLAEFQPRRAEVVVADDFDPHRTESLVAPELEWIAQLEQVDFSRIFAGSAVKRAKLRSLVRNACVALGNSRLTAGTKAWIRVVAVLEKLRASQDELVAEHADWALRKVRKE